MPIKKEWQESSSYHSFVSIIKDGWEFPKIPPTRPGDSVGVGKGIFQNALLTAATRIFCHFDNTS